MISIHDDGNGSSESCSSGSQPTLQAVNGFSDDFESKFDVSLHQDTKGFILEPGRNAKVRIRFAPDTVYDQFRQCKKNSKQHEYFVQLINIFLYRKYNC